MKELLTHPDNHIFENFIHSSYLQYYQIKAEQHKGNEIHTGRPCFKILKVTHMTNNRQYQDWVTIWVEYDPNFLTHFFQDLLNIGYRSGFQDARDVYDVKPKTNKTNKSNETVN